MGDLYRIELTKRELALLAVAFEYFERSDWTIDLNAYRSLLAKVAVLAEQAKKEGT
jgi:hypothetical protein